MPKRPKNEKPEIEKDEGFDFGLGKISIGGSGMAGLGGVFEGIGNLLGAISKMQQEGKGIISETGEIRGLGDKVKGVYGFTVSTLATGEQKVEHFGHVIKKTPKGPVVEELREPIVDVFDEKDHILVVAELPGIKEEDIKTDIKGNVLNISSEKGERKYKKEVLLPSKVKAEPISSTYKNGILEIKLKKQAP
ncbi:MAG: heat shock protein [Candidatus Scalindua rubra]|uniref:Heat shock protein n=1 Tax=Candidatus Scalindua rubra TaxID=1872076 RepID=A0A1E3XF68_9BACT|nr:MAG: heat shock protein [Candidatus Scalindua rubra]